MMTIDAVEMLIYYYNFATSVRLSNKTTLGGFQKYMEGKTVVLGENGLTYYLIKDVEDFLDKVDSGFCY